jgi:putative glutamine amidotransferase
MREPIVGLNCVYEEVGGFYRYRLDSEYIDMLKKAGASSIILPLFENAQDCAKILEKLDGVLLTGGADVNPARWNEELHPKTKMLHPKKEASDFLLVKTAFQIRKPLLGICYGAQLINVVRGGTLFQHLPDLADLNKLHSQGAEDPDSMHEVNLEPSSRLGRIFGKKSIMVNSYHHQAIRGVGDGLSVVGRADDGVVEALEGEGDLVLAVQWHPERMQGKEGLLIFEEFVQRILKMM